MWYINIYTIMEGENISAYYNIENKNIVFIKIQYFLKINKKVLALCKIFAYNSPCCGMIVMKREVAAHSWRVFRGANVKLGN